MPGLSRLQADILERWDAEEKASFGRTIRNLFDDPRRASASVGVSVVASLCLALGAFVLAQSPIRHPESLKAAMTQSSRARTADIYLPACRDAAARRCGGGDAGDGDQPRRRRGGVCRARDGRRLSRRSGIYRRPHQGRRSLPTHEQLSELLNAVATARFEPARVAGAPVSLNVVWLVTHTTVRAPLRAYVHVRVDGWKML